MERPKNQDFICIYFWQMKLLNSVENTGKRGKIFRAMLEKCFDDKDPKNLDLEERKIYYKLLKAYEKEWRKEK